MNSLNFVTTSVGANVAQSVYDCRGSGWVS